MDIYIFSFFSRVLSLSSDNGALSLQVCPLEILLSSIPVAICQSYDLSNPEQRKCTWDKFLNLCRDTKGQRVGRTKAVMALLADAVWILY